MKWINHVAIAGATTAVVAPPLVPVAIAGGTAPDWIEWVLQAAGRSVKHRSSTHILAVWLALWLGSIALWDWHGLIAAFAWGGLTHVLADACTVAGVPATPWADRRIHLFGGRLRTGGAGEYLVAGAVMVLCWMIAGQIQTQGGYQPFFPDWAGRYERGLVTAKEWRDNRFRFF